jgi:transcriptional regulator with XRE-family HTH domain
MAPVTKPKPVLGAHYLRAWRDYRDIRQQVAADAINVSRELLSKIEAFKSPYSQPQIEGLAKLYRTTVAELLVFDPTVPEPKISGETNIRKHLARIDGLPDGAIDPLWVFISGYLRGGEQPPQAQPDDQSEPASLRHAVAPSR